LKEKEGSADYDAGASHKKDNKNDGKDSSSSSGRRTSSASSSGKANLPNANIVSSIS
jgi:hypothetical protein